VKGSAKEAVMARALLNLFGVIIFVTLFYVEIVTHIPLVKSFVGFLSDDIRHQAAFVVLLFNFLIPFIFSFLLTPYYRILIHFWPPLEEEALSKIKFIHEHAADDPETAILLIEKEILRLLKRIPLYLDMIRPGIKEGTVTLDTYHNAFGEVSSEIQLFIADVFHKALNLSTSETLLNVQNRHTLVASLEDNVYGLCKTLEGKTEGGESGRLAMNIVESLDAIFLTAIETTESGDGDDLDILITLTSDRGQLMEKIRSIYLSSEKDLSPEERSLILYITNLFERSVWMLGRYGMFLSQNAAG
jgi:phosphate:Na+ symporter